MIVLNYIEKHVGNAQPREICMIHLIHTKVVS